MKITTPINEETTNNLKVGDIVYISGTIYTARDAAHKRLCEMIEAGKELPFPLQDAWIYYVGPTPTAPGKAFGSAGPTTSMRMDAYAPTLYDLGVKATIGKGYRTQAVADSIAKNNALYLVAIGGAGALLSKSIKKAEMIAFEDLGAEAIQKLTVEDFPATVAIDARGNSIYD